MGNSLFHMLFKEGNITISERYYEKKEQWMELIKTILEDIGKNNIRLGVGKTADAVLTNNDACLKIVDKANVRKNRILITNHVNQEIEYLEKLNDKYFLEKAGINEQVAPIPILSTEEKGYGFLLMEKIHGSSLQDILDQKESNINTNKVNWQDFFKKLEDIVNKLNTAGIFHRDLHAGNIMIDENHSPVLIDFGSSYEASFSGDNPYNEESIAGVVVYKKDITHIQEIKKKFVK